MRDHPEAEERRCDSHRYTFVNPVEPLLFPATRGNALGFAPRPQSGRQVVRGAEMSIKNDLLRLYRFGNPSSATNAKIIAAAASTAEAIVNAIGAPTELADGYRIVESGGQLVLVDPDGTPIDATINRNTAAAFAIDLATGWLVKVYDDAPATWREGLGPLAAVLLAEQRQPEGSGRDS